MYSTRDVLAVLRRANPHSHVTEERLRRAIRDERIDCPLTFAGRFAWSADDVRAAAAALGLSAPNLRGQELQK